MLHLGSLALVALVAAADPPAPAAPAPAPAPAAAPAAPADAAPAAPAPATTSSPLPPPSKPRLLAMDLVDKGAGKEVTDAVNQAMQGQAVQSFVAGEVVTSTQIKIVLDAAANQAMLGCESEKCMTDLGKTVEASIVLGGSVAKVGDDYLITILAVNERDGSRIAQQQRKTPANRELYYYAAKQLTSLVLTGRAVDPRVPVLVKIDAKDGDGTIIIDGKEVATASQTTAQLDPGSHEIRVRKPGKAEWKTLVNVEEATPVEVTADLVDSRLTLWPAAAGTGGVALAALAVGLGFGIAAQDTFDGATHGWPLPGTDKTPEQSYSKITPVDSQQLFTLEQEVKTRSALADGFFIASGVLAVAAVGLEATDIILNATAE